MERWSFSLKKNSLSIYCPPVVGLKWTNKKKKRFQEAHILKTEIDGVRVTIIRVLRHLRQPGQGAGT